MSDRLLSVLMFIIFAALAITEAHSGESWPSALNGLVAGLWLGDLLRSLS